MTWWQSAEAQYFREGRQGLQIKIWKIASNEKISNSVTKSFENTFPKI